MFALIIAVIAIALVVSVLAVSSYFGGGTISDAQARAHATRLVIEETQILAAMDLFQAEHKRYPASVDELVSSGFLRSIPKGMNALTVASAPAFELIASAHAAEPIANGVGWGLLKAGAPAIVTPSTVPLAICKAYNLVSRGDDGVLLQPYEALPAQCYGAQGSYQIVVRRATVTLQGLLDISVEQGSLPAKGMADWWDNAPTQDVKLPTDPTKAPSPALRLQGPAGGLDFGSVQVGQHIRSAQIDVSNHGTGPAKALNVRAPDGFEIADSSCGNELPAGGSCTFAVIFSPSMAQTYTGTVTAEGDKGGPAQMLAEGIGVPGAVSITDIDFGGQMAGASVTRASVLTNTGIGPLTLGAPSVTGQGFSLAQGTTCGASLSAGSSCTIPVTLAPIGMQAHTGALVVPVAEAAPARATLSGQSRATYVVEQTESASGSVSIPASVTSLTLTGYGGPGGDNTVNHPGQPYIAPTPEQAATPAVAAKPATYSWAYTNYYADRGSSDYGVPYDTCTITPAVPTTVGQLGYCEMQLIGSQGDYFYYIYYYKAVINQPAQAAVPAKPYVPASPGQPYIPPSKTGGPTRGSPAEAVVEGARYQFDGGLGLDVKGVATTQVLTITSGEAKQLSFTIPAGGSLTYKFSYTLPY